MVQRAREIAISLLVYFFMVGIIFASDSSRETRAEAVWYLKNLVGTKMEIRVDLGGKEKGWERWKPTDRIKMGKVISEREPCTFDEAMQRAFECQRLINEARK